MIFFSLSFFITVLNLEDPIQLCAEEGTVQVQKVFSRLEADGFRKTHWI